MSNPIALTTLQTTCSSDGKIIAWDVSEEEPKIERMLEGLIPVVTDNQYVLNVFCIGYPFRQTWIGPKSLDMNV